MTKAPTRTLTVCEGRNTIGHIQEIGGRQFLALSIAGTKLGVYPTSAEAAQALTKAQMIGGGT
jgi:hypothetical protein